MPNLRMDADRVWDFASQCGWWIVAVFIGALAAVIMLTICLAVLSGVIAMVRDLAPKLRRGTPKEPAK